MKSKAGFTLLEILVAVILLALILPAASYFVRSARADSARSLHREQAAAVSQMMVDSLSMLAPRLVTPTAQGQPHVREIAGRRFEATCRVLAPAGTSDRIAVVTVHWRQGDRLDSVTSTLTLGVP